MCFLYRLRQRSNSKNTFFHQKWRLRQRSRTKKRIFPSIYHAEKLHEFAIFGTYHSTLMLQSDLLQETNSLLSSGVEFSATVLALRKDE